MLSILHALSLNALSACCICGRPSGTVRHKSSHDQLYPLYHWFHGFRYVVEAGFIEAAIWIVLLGPHDPSHDRRLKVCSESLFKELNRLKLYF